MPIRHRRTRQIAWVRCPTSVSRCLTMTVAACSATVFTGTNDIVVTGAPLDHRLYHFLCIPYSADTPLARHPGHLSRHPCPITATCPPSRPSLPLSAPDHRRLPAIPAISPVIRARPPPLARHPGHLSRHPRPTTAACPPSRSPATPLQHRRLPTTPLARHPRSNTAAFPPPRSPAILAPTPPLSRHQLQPHFPPNPPPLPPPIPHHSLPPLLRLVSTDSAVLFSVSFTGQFEPTLIPVLCRYFTNIGDLSHDAVAKAWLAQNEWRPLFPCQIFGNFW